MSEYLNIILSILCMVLTVGGFFAIVIGLRTLKSKINNEYLIEAIDIIQAVVDKINQTYVEELKLSGKFDIEAQQAALRTAIEESRELMSDKLRKYVEENFGDLEKWIIIQIESYIYNSKLEIGEAVEIIEDDTEDNSSEENTSEDNIEDSTVTDK